MGAAAPIRAAQSQHAATAKRMCHRVLRSEAVHGVATATLATIQNVVLVRNDAALVANGSSGASHTVEADIRAAQAERDGDSHHATRWRATT